MVYSILFILTVQVYLGRADCVINPLVYSKSPLVIPTGTDTFIYPEVGETTLRIGAGETVDLVCPGGVLVVLEIQTTEVVQATCISDDMGFNIFGERTMFTQVYCAQDSIVSSRYTGRSCESGGRDVEVGFSLWDGRFLRVLEICYDTARQTPLYTYYNLTRSIGKLAKRIPRPEFTEDSEFYNIDNRTVNELYSRGVQRTTINNLLGLSTNSTKYIQNGEWFFLSRGHLAAKADFFYPAQQNATFRYINAAPQWATFNGMNWNDIEQSTRDYADRNGADLQVWTGIYDVATISHEKTALPVDLYLYTSFYTYGLPVPALYWKVIYYPARRRGIAFVGLNNPYKANVADQIICSDVSSSVSWVKWNPRNITQGYSYACEILDLKRTISYVPNLIVSGLLV